MERFFHWKHSRRPAIRTVSRVTRGGTPSCSNPNLFHGFPWKDGLTTDSGTLAGTDCSTAVFDQIPKTQIVALPSHRTSPSSTRFYGRRVKIPSRTSRAARLPECVPPLTFNHGSVPNSEVSLRNISVAASRWAIVVPPDKTMLMRRTVAPFGKQ